jgi:hypothetical protein
MRVIVCGGRDYNDRERVFAALDAANARRNISVLRHGACRDKRTKELKGADRWADEWGSERGVEVQRFEADWDRLGPRAGPMRNQEMADAGADACIAFPGGRGTADMVRRAIAARIVVWKPFG